MKIGAGSTPQGQSNWQDYIVAGGTKYGIFLDVDTSSAGFTSTPVYVSAIGGTGWHWETTGGSAIYNPTLVPGSGCMYAGLATMSVLTLLIHLTLNLPISMAGTSTG